MEGQPGGTTTVDKHRRISGAERDEVAAELKRHYERGATLRELVSLTGRSYGFIHRILRESGVVLRSRGGRSQEKASPTGRGRP